MWLVEVREHLVLVVLQVLVHVSVRHVLATFQVRVEIPAHTVVGTDICIVCSEQTMQIHLLYINCMYMYMCIDMNLDLHLIDVHVLIF